MSLAKKTLTSALWSFTTGYANILFGFIGNLLLARILEPDDFGVFGFASSILVFITMFTGFGSQEAIMQCRDESISDLIPTAYWMSLLLGIIVAIVGVITGVIVLPIYGHTIGWMIIILATFVPITSLANAHSALLRRDMVYKPVALIQSITTIASFVLGIVSAYLGMGPWALLVRQGSSLIIFWIGMEFTCGYRLHRIYNRKAARWIWDFGWKKMFLQINEVIYGRFDNLMVGNFLGNTELGYYGQAFRLAILGQQFTQGAISPILLPLFSAMQFSLSKLRRSFESVSFWICRVIPLLGILIFLSGKNLIILLYGEKWAMAGVYFQMMFILFMFLPLAAMLKSFLVGAGSIDIALKIGIVQVVFFITGVTLGAVQRNISFVIWSVNLNYFLAAVLMGIAVRKIIPINWWYLCAAPIVAFIATMTFGQWFITLLPSSLIGMLLLVIILTLLYLTTLLLFEYRSLLKETSFILEISGRKS
jgi:O-antigen/teichoic acid export membrane protein